MFHFNCINKTSLLKVYTGSLTQMNRLYIRFSEHPVSGLLYPAIHPSMHVPLTRLQFESLHVSHFFSQFSPNVPLLHSVENKSYKPVKYIN